MTEVVTGDDGGQSGSIEEGEENRPQDRTLRNTTGEFDRIGLRVVDRHCLEPVGQIRFELGEGSTVDSIWGGVGIRFTFTPV